MCDLKRTLDATVCPTYSPWYYNMHLTRLGALCLGNAFRYRENCLSAFPNRFIPTGECLFYFTSFSTSCCRKFYPMRRKLIYCSRTVPEIEKALAELKRLMAYRISHAETDEEREKESNYSGLGLTSRKNLCIHPEVRSHVVHCNECNSATSGLKREEGESGRRAVS